MRRIVQTVAVLALIFFGSTFGGMLAESRRTLASRDGSGNYTLPAGSMNPAVAGTPIKSADMNTTLNDLKTEMTDSLSRSGKGAMTANLGIGGTAVEPLDVQRINGLTLARFGTTGPVYIARDNVAWNLQIDDGVNWKYGTTTTGALISRETSTGGVTVYSAPSGTAGNTATLTQRLQVNGSGVTIGATGTAISASYRGTTSWTPGSIGANTCVTTTVSLTGAAAGADCVVTIPSGTPVASVWTSCSVTSNTCNLYQCNADNVNAHTGDVGTYACRVFNP